MICTRSSAIKNYRGRCWLKVMIDFILYLSTFFIIMLLFHVIWRYVVITLLTLLVMLLRIPEKVSYLFRIAEIYFICSLIGLVTIGASYEYSSTVAKILLYIFGAFVLFSYYISSVYQKEKEARQQFDFETLEGINFDYLLSFCTVPLFILVLLFPAIATTTPNMYFLKVINWIYGFKGIGRIIRIILSIWGGVTALGWIFNAFLYLVAIISQIFKKNDKKTNNEELS